MRVADLRQAAERYEAALKLFTQIDAKLGQANTQKSLGDLAMRVADLRQAAERYEAALKLFTQIDAKLGQANTLVGLGDLQDRQDKPEQAMQSYQMALGIYTQMSDRYSIARTILLSMGPFLTRRSQIEAAFQAYAQGLLVTLEMDAQFFWSFQNGVFQVAKEMVRTQPGQAAAGCAALLDELRPTLEQAGQSGDEQSEQLLRLTAAIFQVAGLAALAAGQSGPEQAETLVQAQELAGRVDTATGSAFNLAAWLQSG
jgi:tetratricopeptide (TPR) repeat protein